MAVQQRRGAPIIALCAGGLLLSACSPPSQDTGEANDRVAVWHTPLYHGCQSVLAGPICLMGADDSLQIWVPHIDGSLVVEGGEVSEQLPLDGGQFLTVLPGRLPGALIIRPQSLSSVSPSPPKAWRLDLANAEALEPHLSKARSLRMARRLDDAIASLAQLPAQTDTPQGALLSAYQSHLEGLANLATGDADGGLTMMERAIATYARLDRPQELVDAGTIALFLRLKRSEFPIAGTLLSNMRASAERLEHLGAQSRYLIEYYTGALASHVGDYRNALTHLQRAASTARRMRLEGNQQLAEQWLALQLQAVGRRDEADALLVSLAERTDGRTGPCARAQLDTNIGWNRLLALESRHAASDPLEPLQRALAAYQDASCPATQEQLLNARINLALAHLHTGDVAVSARLLRTLRSEGDLSPTLSMWLHDVQARVSLRQGDARAALKAYDALAAAARERYDDQARWRAQAGRAQALEGLGDTPGALSAYRDAEELLALQTVQVPVNEGRDTFLARHTWVTLDYLRLLIASGDAQTAFAVAREARSRALRSLRRADRLATLDPREQERWHEAMAAYVRARDQLAADAAEDWALPADTLAHTRAAREATVAELRSTLDQAFSVLDRAPEGDPSRAGSSRARPPGETQLLYLPVSTHEGEAAWLAFAHSDVGLLATEIECGNATATPADIPSKALSHCLLDPFTSHLEAGAQLRVLTSGALSEVDFHALRWRGQSLLAHAPISYALDAPGHGQQHVDRGPARALVVADPRGDLPAARSEAGRVATLLGQQHPQHPQVLLGRDASLSRLRESLEQTDLFHYAGHAMFDGRDGWDSTLPLAGEDTFNVGDILALRHAPAQVVLSGCETGRSTQAGASQGIGIAHAFLAAGSRSVIAATRPVDDHVAQALVTALYERWRVGADTAQALREAQLALARQAPEEDWFSFRHMAL